MTCPLSVYLPSLLPAHCTTSGAAASAASAAPRVRFGTSRRERLPQQPHKLRPPGGLGVGRFPPPGTCFLGDSRLSYGQKFKKINKDQHCLRVHPAAPSQSGATLPLIRTPRRRTNIGPIVHQFCALSRASTIFFASATIASSELFSSVAGLSGSADDEPGGKIIALQPFPTRLTSRRYPL
jgi:hypothetical protein